MATLQRNSHKTDDEKEKNRAIKTRQETRLTAHPYAKKDSSCVEKTVFRVRGTKYVDSGGGFLIEESDLSEENVPKDAEDNPSSSSIKNQNDEAIPIPITYEECLDCGGKFVDSYLFTKFNYSVCDKCRDPDEKHALITRTEAKEQYLLKDCDLDKREPPLKYISRKNPHNIRWGEMKLYLNLQIEKRAMEVWGDLEEIEKQKEEREEKRVATKIKKYNKKMKELRMDVRSSLFDKTTAASHMHEFGPEIYNEDDDTYTHSCLSCEYTETFEKM